MPAALVLVLQNWITTHNRGLHPAHGGGTERQGGGSWPKRELRSAHVRGATAKQHRAANIAAPTARACPSITCLTPATAGIRCVPLARRYGRRGRFFRRSTRSLQVCPRPARRA